MGYGYVIGNGLGIEPGTNLTIKSSVAYYEGHGYIGNVYLVGTYKRKKLTLQNVTVGGPVFSDTEEGRECSASGMFIYQNKQCFLLFRWVDGSPIGKSGYIEWTVSESVTGNKLLYGAVLITGQMVVKIPVLTE